MYCTLLFLPRNNPVPQVYSFSHVTDEILRERFGVLLLEVAAAEKDSTAAFFVEISDKCASTHGSVLVPELLKMVESWDSTPFTARFNFLLRILNLSVCFLALVQLIVH